MAANMSVQGATQPAAATADGNANVVGSEIINVNSDSGETLDVLKDIWDCQRINNILSSDGKQQWICFSEYYTNNEDKNIKAYTKTDY